MKASELIKALESVPKDAEVWCLWDGAARSEVEVVYLSKNGTIVLAEYGEPIYYDDDRPVGAPLAKDEKYFSFERGQPQ